MLHIHESWREEGGWMLILVGMVALGWGWLNLELQAGLPDNEAVSLLLIGLGIVLTCIGAVVHFTQPDRTDGPAAPYPNRPRVEPMDPMDPDGGI